MRAGKVLVVTTVMKGEQTRAVTYIGSASSL